MLVTSRDNCRPLVVIWRRISRSSSARSGLASLSNSVRPRTRVIGVLNSWLATSMKAVLSCPARANSSLARKSCPLAVWSCDDQPLPFGQQLILLGGLMNDSLELDGVPGFEDVTEDVPFVDRVDHCLDVGVAGEEHADGFGLKPSCLAQERISGHSRHPLIREDQLDLMFIEQGYRLSRPCWP